MLLAKNKSVHLSVPNQTLSECKFREKKKSFCAVCGGGGPQVGEVTCLGGVKK